MVRRPSMAWGAIAFGVTLALVIGMRLDQAALAAVVGVACGIGASVPTSLLVVGLLRRRELVGQKRARSDFRREVNQSPPVVVVAAPASPQLPQVARWPGASEASFPAQREFTVIGDEGMDDGFDYWHE